MIRILKLAAGFTISGVCLTLAFRRVPLDQLWSAATSIPPQTLAIAFTLASITLFLRSLRWRILLAGRAPLNLWIAFRVNSAGQLGNVVLPARMGDFYRATNLGRAGFNTPFTLATVLVERVLDAGFLVFLAALILTGMESAPAWLARGARLVALAATVGLAAAVILPRLESRIRGLCEKVIPKSWRGRVMDLLNEFLDGLRGFQHLARAGSFLALTAAIWSVDTAGIVIVARGLGIAMPPVTAALLISAVALASAVPAAPGNLGVYQLVAISILGVAGIGREPALSLALVMQAMTLATLIVWGLTGFWSLAADDRSLPALPISSETVRIDR